MNITQTIDPNKHEDEIEFKVSRKTNVHKLASALVARLKNRDKVFLSSMGAASVNQATKACIIANQKLGAENLGFLTLHAFYKHFDGETLPISEEEISQLSQAEADQLVEDEQHTCIRTYFVMRRLHE
jgi:stage V sporulation protein SpoVS